MILPVSKIFNLLFFSFRFSKRYELPLLVQSIVMNVTMFLMIHLCVKVKRSNAIMRTRERVFAGMYYAPLNFHNFLSKFDVRVYFVSFESDTANLFFCIHFSLIFYICTSIFKLLYFNWILHET